MLEKIAVEMKRYAVEHPRLKAEPVGNYQQELSGGLTVTLFLDGQHTWRLSLARLGKGPSETEVKVIRRDFEVPEEALRERQTVGQWQVVRLSWREMSQKPLFEVGPATPPNHYLKD